jgi:hypothetical protein
MVAIAATVAIVAIAGTAAHPAIAEAERQDRKGLGNPLENEMESRQPWLNKPTAK